MDVQAYYRPIGFQEVEAPRFLESWHMKVVWLSALCSGRLYPPPQKKKNPGARFCQHSQYNDLLQAGRSGD
jgi:hypothetical protein